MVLPARTPILAEALKMKRPMKDPAGRGPRVFAGPPAPSESPPAPPPARTPVPELGRKPVPPAYPAPRPKPETPPAKRFRTPDELSSRDRIYHGELEHKSLPHRELEGHVRTLAKAKEGSKGHWDAALAVTQHYVPQLAKAAHEHYRGLHNRPASRKNVSDALRTANLGYMSSYGSRSALHGQHYDKPTEAPEPTNPMRRAARRWSEKAKEKGEGFDHKYFGGFVKNSLKTELGNITAKRMKERQSAGKAFKELAMRARRKRRVAPSEPTQPERAAMSKEAKGHDDPKTVKIRDHFHRVIDAMPRSRSAKSAAYPKLLRDYVKTRHSSGWGTDIDQGALGSKHGISSGQTSKLIKKFHDAAKEDPHLGKLAVEWLEGSVTLLEAFGDLIEGQMNGPRTLAVITRVQKAHPCWGKQGEPPEWRAVHSGMKKGLAGRKGVTGAFALKVLRGIHHAHLPKSADKLDKLRLGMQRAKRQERDPKYRQVLAMDHQLPATVRVLGEMNYYLLIEADPLATTVAPEYAKKRATPPTLVNRPVQAQPQQRAAPPTRVQRPAGPGQSGSHLAADPTKKQNLWQRIKGTAGKVAGSKFGKTVGKVLKHPVTKGAAAGTAAALAGPAALAAAPVAIPAAALGGALATKGGRAFLKKGLGAVAGGLKGYAGAERGQPTGATPSPVAAGGAIPGSKMKVPQGYQYVGSQAGAGGKTQHRLVPAKAGQPAATPAATPAAGAPQQGAAPAGAGTWLQRAAGRVGGGLEGAMKGWQGASQKPEPGAQPGGQLGTGQRRAPPPPVRQRPEVRRMPPGTQGPAPAGRPAVPGGQQAVTPPGRPAIQVRKRTPVPAAQPSTGGTRPPSTGAPAGRPAAAPAGRRGRAGPTGPSGRDAPRPPVTRPATPRPAPTPSEPSAPTGRPARGSTDRPTSETPPAPTGRPAPAPAKPGETPAAKPEGKKAEPEATEKPAPTTKTGERSLRGAAGKSRTPEQLIASGAKKQTPEKQIARKAPSAAPRLPGAAGATGSGTGKGISGYLPAASAKQPSVTGREAMMKQQRKVRKSGGQEAHPLAKQRAREGRKARGKTRELAVMQRSVEVPLSQLVQEWTKNQITLGLN